MFLVLFKKQNYVKGLKIMKISDFHFLFKNSDRSWNDSNKTYSSIYFSLTFNFHFPLRELFVFLHPNKRKNYLICFPEL